MARDRLRVITVGLPVVVVIILALVPVACGHTSTSGAGMTGDPTSSTTSAATIRDPYEGSRPAVDPIGVVTSGSIDTSDGRSRHYRLYVPASIDPSTPAPLVVALHGGLGSAEQFAANSGFDGLAEANGFLVVYPDGIGAAADGSGPRTWNGGSCCGAAVRLDVDDVGFIAILIDTVSTEHRVDPARRFAVGHSNGAILAYRLACQLSDRIVAIGLQSGTLGIDACSPSRPVSVLHLHGGADTNIPIAGGVGTGISGVSYRPASVAIDALVDADGCDPLAVVSEDPADRGVKATTWSGCREGTEVRFVLVEGATHAWMGHPATSPGATRLVGDPYLGFDASRAIWSFLAAHPRP